MRRDRPMGVNKLLCVLFGVGMLGASVAEAQLIAPQRDRQREADRRPVMQTEPERDYGGRFELQRTEHDFGRVLDDVKQSTTFRFYNRGDKPLKIKNIQASCGCTVPELDQTVFEPGDGAELTVEFDPSNRIGDQRNTVMIETSDPDNPRTTLMLRGFVRPVVSFEPALVQLGEVLLQEGKSVTIHAVSVDEDFEVTRATVTSGEHLSVEVLEAEEFEDERFGETLYRVPLRVTLAPEAPSGQVRGGISVRTNHSAARIRNLRVFGEVVGDIHVVPNRVNLGLLPPERPFQRQVRVVSRTGKDFEIRSVRVDGDELGDIEYDVRPMEEGKKNAYMVRIRGTAPDEVRAYRGRLVIETDDKEQPRVLADYTATVRRMGGR